VLGAEREEISAEGATQVAKSMPKTMFEKNWNTLSTNLSLWGGPGIT